jgi:hypothetical protein
MHSAILEFYVERQARNLSNQMIVLLQLTLVIALVEEVTQFFFCSVFP